VNHIIEIESLNQVRVVGFLNFEDIGPTKWFSKFLQVDVSGTKLVHIINSSWKNTFGLDEPFEVFHTSFMNKRERRFCLLRARVFDQNFIFLRRVGGLLQFLPSIHFQFRSAFGRRVLSGTGFIFTI
jgi:hypothetical protein